MPASETRVWGLVPAAGTGVRMGHNVPKQYLEINGRPIIHHTLDVLCD
ncbi:MAG: 2-C-methyl-D-erythritol 4-phosphate cytidylyltransferase, partial [Nitrospinaceae bacterium]|nr:2-C-methyl-D-erythritol 4-phosphate cytidylyltransferase [Nitrospinaceae bacterium]